MPQVVKSVTMEQAAKAASEALSPILNKQTASNAPAATGAAADYYNDAINSLKADTTEATKSADQYLGKANDFLTGYTDKANAVLQPFVDASKGALGSLQKFLGLSGSSGEVQAQLEATPGYQFAKEQGLKATQRAMSAAGLGGSGNAVTAAADYASGLAQQTYQSQIGNLMGLIQATPTAAMQQSQNFMQTGQTGSGNIMQTGGVVANLLGQAAQSKFGMLSNRAQSAYSAQLQNWGANQAALRDSVTSAAGAALGQTMSAMGSPSFIGTRNVSGGVVVPGSRRPPMSYDVYDYSRAL